MISFEMKLPRSLLAIVCVVGAVMSVAVLARTPIPSAAAKATAAPQAAIIDGSDTDVQEVVKLEMATLEWSRHHDLDKMAAHHAEDWIGVPGTAPMTRAQMLAGVGTETLRSYKLSNMMTRQLAKDVVLVSYRMQQDGASADGTQWQPLVQASAVSCGVTENGSPRSTRKPSCDGDNQSRALIRSMPPVNTRDASAPPIQ